MNAWLTILTVVSLALAAGFAWIAWTLHDRERQRSAARVAALASAIDGPGSGAPVAVNDLFAPQQSAAARGVPGLKLAVGAIMAIVLAAAVWPGSSSRSRSSADGAPGAPAATSLELMSMRHERQGNRLTVSGLVRNPRGGASMAGVSAVVFAFNRSGAYVTSARATLDFPKLAPGDESPFVVTIPGVADVGRYRVSFRTDAGVVQHVDRRSELLRLASK